MFGNIGKSKVRWNSNVKREKLWKHNLIGKCCKIPMRERDKLWKRNSLGKKWWSSRSGKETIVKMQLNRQRRWNSNVEKRLLWRRNKIQKYNELPMWKRDYCRNTIKSKSMMKFQSGKETVVEMQQNPKRWWNSNMERDKYSIALNIQKSPLNP